jgi:hypothetical protein
MTIPKVMGNWDQMILLSGRNISQDFTITDGWRMYYGNRIPNDLNFYSLPSII